MSALLTMVNGLTSVEVNGHKLKIGVRDVVWFIMLLISLVGTHFANVNRYNGLATRVDTNTSSILSLRDKADKASIEAYTAHDEVLKLQQQVGQNASAITSLAQTTDKLTPKVERIDANVLWLMGKQMERK